MRKPRSLHPGVKRIAFGFEPALRAATKDAGEKADHDKHDRDYQEHMRAGDGCASDAAEAKRGSYHCDDQKHDRVVNEITAHLGPP